MRDGLRHADPDFEIAFFCECDNPDCYAAVWLTGTAFEERLATSHPIVVTGHGPSVASKKPLS